MKDIAGCIIDQQGRCTHYHSEYDVVANKCYKCLTYYACYRCHDEKETHLFAPWPVTSDKEAKVILCGTCQYEMNYEQYKKEGLCPNCKQRFNPKCVNHESIYFKK
ncbi:CHY zinc finger protein [Enterococcus termitis]|jgi:uncharacterized CHY-type Zn-finger protein|uniref:CHY-type domain-containing protein n=1 Tax=Enterococcus termitis TaxID=332950 RepID=A0A1E5GLC9_9ENTE|nr:CHY zinc finger protein [Enterococcus termitis]OEG13030.1 hypothetical protein BCR25_05955 [Enterococcus termitis]